jgi:DNA-binding NarL/FixJ family response regulator
MSASGMRALRRLSDAVAAWNQSLTQEQLRDQVVTGLARVVPGDLVSYYELRPPSTILGGAHHPAEIVTVEVAAVVRRVVSDHPLVRHVVRTGDRAATRLSDVIGLRDLKRLALYQDLYRPLGWNRYLSAGLPGPSTTLRMITIGRGGVDFSDADCVLFDFARINVAQALNAADHRELLNAATTVLAGADDGTYGVVLLGADRVIRFTNATARSLLAGYFPRRCYDGHTLPEELTAWFAAQRQGEATTPPSLREPFVATRQGRTLTVTLVPGDDHGSLLLSEVREQESAAPASASLTRRQAQVLGLADQGLTSYSIGLRLGITARTVEHHLAGAYAKLDAHNRAEALVRAFGPRTHTRPSIGRTTDCLRAPK